MKNQWEEIGALRSAKKNTPPRRTGQKRQKKQPEKAAPWGERCPWKRTVKKNLVKKKKAKEKAIKGRMCRERSNNAILKRTEKRKHMARGCDKWHLCKAGSFSYGESPRTPPLEGTSLHRRNNSVERPWGILSLFTTCLQVQSPCHSLWHMWTTPQTAH